MNIDVAHREHRVNIDVTHREHGVNIDVAHREHGVYIKNRCWPIEDIQIPKLIY